MRLPRPRLRTAAAIILAQTTWVSLAHAEATPYFIGLSQSLDYQHNVLRLGREVQTPEGLKRSDTISTTTLQGGIDQPFGRQRGYGNLALRQVSYLSNSIYNNQAYTANAGLDWSTIERISGSLLATANRGLSSFGAYGLGVQDKNLEDTRGFNASVSVGLVTEYSLEAGYNFRQVRNSLVNRAVLSRDFDQDTGSVGVRWRPSPATNLGLTFRDTRGRYPKFQQTADGGFLADRFKQQAVEISGAYQASGVSSIDVRLSQNKTRYDLNQARDFSGVTGSLGWTWQPTGKVRVATRFSRDTGQDSYAVAQFNVPTTSDYTRANDLFRVQADWEASAKIGVTASWQSLQRDVTQNLSANGSNGIVESTGRDLSHLFTLGARWTPYRVAALGCEAGMERRSASGALAEPMRNYSFNCYGQVQLQL